MQLKLLKHVETVHGALMIINSKVFIPTKYGVRVLDCRTMVTVFYNTSYFDMSKIFDNPTVKVKCK